MLDGYIIEQLRRREEERRRDDARPRLELPLPPLHWPERPRDNEEEEEEPARVIIIDL